MLLLGAGLLLVAAPFDGEDSGAEGYPLSKLEKKAVRVERRLGRKPNDLGVLQSTALAWMEAGNKRTQGVETRTEPIPAAASDDYRNAVRTWNRYLRRTGGEAGGDFAELAGRTYFRLAEIGSRNLGEIEANVTGAARALRIAGIEKPEMFTLSNTAIYAYFNGEFARGNTVSLAAAADIERSKRRLVLIQLHEYRERAEYFRGQLRRARAELRETGEELLDQPLQAYSSSTELNRDDPTNPIPPVRAGG